jgi:hypothetical protein
MRQAKTRPRPVSVGALGGKRIRKTLTEGPKAQNLDELLFIYQSGMRKVCAHKCNGARSFTNLDERGWSLMRADLRHHLRC